MEKISVKFNYYRFDISKEDQNAAYIALMAKAPKVTWTSNHDYPNKNIPLDRKALAYWENLKGFTEVNIETEHVFSNQWDTSEGFRVWLHHVVTWPNKSIKQGYFLTDVDELFELLRNTAACGYCGKQEPMAKGYTFCPHCIGSEYLTVDCLHLTRMQSVVNEKRAKLSSAEEEYLLPLYKEAQLRGNGARSIAKMKKMRSDVESKHVNAIKKANAEYAGLIWLLDKGLNVDNVIYYPHTDIFAFGWRNPVDDALVSELLDLVSEAPFNYEIKCADGRKLSNWR